MNTHELKIAKAILDVVHGRDELASRMLIHAEVELLLEEKFPVAEFNDVFDRVDKKGWLLGVPNTITGLKKWKISTAGKAARLELSE